MIPKPDVQVQHLSFRESGQFSARDVAYAEQDEALQPFMEHPPTLEAFAKTIEQRKALPVDRSTLVEVLQEQYKRYKVKAPANVEALAEETTFTLTTAHQASLFLGPLYYVYKILSAVALSRKLAAAYEGFHFVPVFVLGAEDHDLDEINHMRIKGERVVWNTKQTGATGDMSLQDLGDAVQAVKERLGPSHAARDIRDLLERAYRPNTTLGHATAHFVAELFRTYGVVVVNLSDVRFKRNFSKYIEREVLEQPSRELIDATVKDLEQAGFAQQAHARDINFFYLQPGRRDRLVREEDRTRVLDTEITWTDDQLREHIAKHPERFSPNVVMRPLLQETALPNLAYVGGGGELAYWLERKAQFKDFGVPFPMLVRRDSAWWIDYKSHKQLQKLALSPRDLLGDKHALLRRYVTTHAATDIDLSEHRTKIQRLLEDVASIAEVVDPTLEARVLARAKRNENELNALETRLVRQMKKQQRDSVARIEALHANLLPGGGLQERTDSFMNEYVKFGTYFFDTLLSAFDPLDMRLKVFVEQSA